jgi:hypothetical protein
MAAGQSHAKCFDFSTKVTKPIYGPIAFVANQDANEKGKTSSGSTWAGVRGVVHSPIEKVLSLLLDHENTKSSRVREFEVEKQADPNYLEKHVVKFTIKPFPLITVEWKEQWGFALADGTVDKPSEIVVSYEKTEGTSHIEHLCGSFVLRKLGETSTDLYYYEEAKATNRSVDDTLNGLIGTFKTLRSKK